MLGLLLASLKYTSRTSDSQTIHFPAFYLNLLQESEAGGCVKSLLAARPTNQSEDQMQIAVNQDLLKSLNPAQKYAYEESKVYEMKVFIFSRLINLQTLVVEYPDLTGSPFVEKVDGRQVPLSFLTNSLKRLHICRRHKRTKGLTVQRAVWLLCFCSLLHQAILNFSVNPEGAEILQDHHEGFKGKSNVKKLTIEVWFENGVTSLKEWGKGLGTRKKLRTGNRKSGAVYHALSATKELEIVEISMSSTDEDPDTAVNIARIEALLAGSRQSLRYLCLFGLFPDGARFEGVVDYSIFKNLKTFSLWSSW